MESHAYPPVAAGGSKPVLPPHPRRRTARVGDAAVLPYPKAPDTDSPVFLWGVLGIFFLLLCSVLLAMLALFQDWRTRQRQG
jgi:hypothetical protein